MSNVDFETIDPVEGDLLVTYQSPTSESGTPVVGASPAITCKVPDGTVVDLDPEENPAGTYTAAIDTTDYGGGNYIFRWKFSGAFVGAIEYKVKVLKSKVLN